MSQTDCGARTQHPWSTLLPAHPNTDVWPTNSLPPTVLGCTDGTSIWLTVEQTVAEARCTLIPIDELADVLTQTRSDLEAAELLWVDVDTLRTRLAFLDDVERSRLGLTHDLAC